MKRDMDLVREILLKLESLRDPEEVFGGENFAERDFAELYGHLEIMKDAGLIDFENISASGQCIGRLTWAGHEFLDQARDPERWQKAKSIMRGVGSMSFEILKDTLKRLITDAVLEALA
ncbi:MAG: DUF2513 domain-containing protein [Myxococcota bacterium]|nr:DUF2513 domain-containing protein [Myxococcota bacterium]